MYTQWAKNCWYLIWRFFKSDLKPQVLLWFNQVYEVLFWKKDFMLRWCYIVLRNFVANLKWWNLYICTINITYFPTILTAMNDCVLYYSTTYMKCSPFMLSDCASDRIFELCLISKYLQSGVLPNPKIKCKLSEKKIFGGPVKK